METEKQGFYVTNQDIVMGNVYIKKGSRVEIEKTGFYSVKLKGYPNSVKMEWLTWIPQANTVRYGRKEMMSASGDDTTKVKNSMKYAVAVYVLASFILGFIIGKESHKK